MLLSHTGGLWLVVAEEHVLETWLVTGQRHDGVLRRRLDHGIRGALHREAHRRPSVQGLHVGHAFQPSKGLDLYRVGKRDRDLVALDVLELRDAADPDEPALADDADSRARLLDLVQDMRGEEHRAPLVPRLHDHAVELLLVQRIEAAGRLIEDEDARPVHESLDEDDFPLVARRVLAKLPAGVEVEPLDELLHVRLVDAAAEVGEIFEQLPTGEVGVERRLARHIADQPLDVERPIPAVETGDPSRARIGPQERHEDANGGRLARAVRAEKSEHLALSDLERDIDDAPLSAVAFVQLLYFDHRCGHLPRLLRLQRSMIPLLSRSQNSCTSTISFIRLLALPGRSSDSARCIALKESLTLAKVPVNVDSISSVAS